MGRPQRRKISVVVNENESGSGRHPRGRVLFSLPSVGSEDRVEGLRCREPKKNLVRRRFLGLFCCTEGSSDSDSSSVGSVEVEVEVGDVVGDGVEDSEGSLDGNWGSHISIHSESVTLSPPLL